MQKVVMGVKGGEPWAQRSRVSMLPSGCLQSAVSMTTPGPLGEVSMLPRVWSRAQAWGNSSSRLSEGFGVS